MNEKIDQKGFSVAGSLFSDRLLAAQSCRRFSTLLHKMALPAEYAALLNTFYQPFAAWLQDAREQQTEPLVVGLCGAQGSGKSTIARLVAAVLEQEYGLQTLVLSLDDYYLTKKRRLQLAATRHPLFQTRGVPGTHDTRLGITTLRRVLTQTPDDAIKLPVFNKAEDDRAVVSGWPDFKGRPDIVLLEGWCVGARPQPLEQLHQAVNILEQEYDPNGVWRQMVNEFLAGPYQRWFALLDRLVLLQIPDFSLVGQWRGLQEKKLFSNRAGQPAGSAMSGRTGLDAPALQRFIMHYERLTRHILLEMPPRADLVIAVNHEHMPHWPGEPKSRRC